jgi:hypothetical protein
VGGGSLAFTASFFFVTGQLLGVTTPRRGGWESIRSIMDGARHFGEEKRTNWQLPTPSPGGRRVRKHQVLSFFSLPLCLRLICIITTEF